LSTRTCARYGPYYRARYYDPIIGRFASEDPYEDNGERSLFTYVRNAPTAFIDPSGLSPEKPCQCNGTSGGISVAVKCCQAPPPVDSDAGQPPYDPCFTYMMVNANFMYRHGGDGAWGNVVRGCLQCAYRYGTNSTLAHAFCYGSGYQRTAHLWDAALSPAWGNRVLIRAVGAAAVGITDQGIQYVLSRGRKPFGCLNVK
jgi:hypothetical protein